MIGVFSSFIDNVITQESVVTFTDYDINGILVGEILRLHAQELMPKMKQMYDLNLVD